MILRWILVLPAFLAGFILVPALINILWELGFLPIPHYQWLTEVIQAIKSLIAGLAGVMLAQRTAPSHNRFVGITCAVLTVGASLFISASFGGYERFHLALSCVGATAAVFFGWNSRLPEKVHDGRQGDNVVN